MTELSDPRPFDLSRCIGAITTSVSNKLSSGASQEYRVRFGLGVVEWRVMAHLASVGSASGADLSSAIGLDKASVSRSLGLLTKRDLIETRGAAGRRKIAALSALGWDMHHRILSVARAREASLLDGFDEAEVDALVLLLNKLSANLAGVEADAVERLDRDVRAADVRVRSAGNDQRSARRIA